jgi:hypothetical protein
VRRLSTIGLGLISNFVPYVNVRRALVIFLAAIVVVVATNLESLLPAIASAKLWLLAQTAPFVALLLDIAVVGVVFSLAVLVHRLSGSFWLGVLALAAICGALFYFPGGPNHLHSNAGDTFELEFLRSPLSFGETRTLTVHSHVLPGKSETGDCPRTHAWAQLVGIGFDIDPPDAEPNTDGTWSWKITAQTISIREPAPATKYLSIQLVDTNSATEPCRIEHLDPIAVLIREDWAFSYVLDTLRSNAHRLDFDSLIAGVLFLMSLLGRLPRIAPTLAVMMANLSDATANAARERDDDD